MKPSPSQLFADASMNLARRWTPAAPASHTNAVVFFVVMAIANGHRFDRDSRQLRLAAPVAR